MLRKKGLKHDKKFSSAAPGLLFPDLIDLLQDELFTHQLLHFLFLLLVISLRRITQQSANRLQTETWIGLFHFLDCWLPGFFLMEMPVCFSAMLIMVSRGSALSFSHCSCFSKVASFSCIASVYCCCFSGSFFFELFMPLM